MAIRNRIIVTEKYDEVIDREEFLIRKTCGDRTG